MLSTTAFIQGGRSVWGNTEKWIRKFSRDYPVVLELWTEFAKDSRRKSDGEWPAFLTPSQSIRLTHFQVSSPTTEASGLQNGTARIAEVRERNAA